MPLERYYRAVTDFGTDDDDYRRALVAHAERAPPIELAWKPGYAEATRRIVEAFARHAETRGWNRTRFQFYLNNKYYWKQPSRWHGRGSAPGSSYWLLDEPRDRADFHALAWYHRLYREGVAMADATHVRFENRVDISRPQFDWGLLDQAIDLYAVSGAFHRYERLVQQRVARVGGEAWLYGGGAGVDAPPLAYRLLVLHSWLLGADGLLPTYTAFARRRGWDRPEQLAIVLSGRPRGLDVPVASIRLKAARRGVQDVLYLDLLSERQGRKRVARRVANSLALSADFSAREDDDPGQMRFDAVSTDDMERLRAAIAAELLARPSRR